MEEESFDAEPLMQAQSRLELSELRDELAQLRPQMALTAEDSRKAQKRYGRNSASSRRNFRSRARGRSSQIAERHGEVAETVAEDEERTGSSISAMAASRGQGDDGQTDTITALLLCRVESVVCGADDFISRPAMRREMPRLPR